MKLKKGHLAPTLTFRLKNVGGGFQSKGKETISLVFMEKQIKPSIQADDLVKEITNLKCHQVRLLDLSMKWVRKDILFSQYFGLFDRL